MFILSIIFMVLALATSVGFICMGERFAVWIWPINAAIWCLTAIVRD